MVRDERAVNKLEMMYPGYGWLPEHFFQRIPGQCLNPADTESSLTGLYSPVAGLPAAGLVLTSEKVAEAPRHDPAWILSEAQLLTPMPSNVRLSSG